MSRRDENRDRKRDLGNLAFGAAIGAAVFWLFSKFTSASAEPQAPESSSAEMKKSPAVIEDVDRGTPVRVTLGF